MNKLLATGLLLLLTWACVPDSSQMNNKDDEYENFEKFELHVAKQASVLGKKYAIKELDFDVECIYQSGDLSKLVREMLDLGSLRYKLLSERQDEAKKQYVSLFQVGSKEYEFRTSSEGDYVDLETVIPVLELIAKDNTPDFVYTLSNQNGGQSAILLFANSKALAAAVEEGYPCSLPGSEWRWEDQWKWGVYSEITLSRIPDFNQLQTNYYQTLTELYQKGYNVPKLTASRLYITDLFKTNSVDILLDGGPDAESSNVIVGNKIKCMWESWGVLLAYTLVKKYGGQPALYDKTRMMRTPLSPAEYMRKAEHAFGKR